jgi:CHAD domain-containing protein
LIDLKEQLKNLYDETALHTARKILKDLLYTFDHIKDEAVLPKAISGENELRSLAKALGDYRDKCIQLEFLQPEYVDKINDPNEKALLERIKKTWQDEKQIIMQQLHNDLEVLRSQL